MERDDVIKLCSDLKLSIRNDLGSYDAICAINELIDSDWDLRESVENLKSERKSLEDQIQYLQTISTEQVLKYRELDRVYWSVVHLIGMRKS